MKKQTESKQTLKAGDDGLVLEAPLNDRWQVTYQLVVQRGRLVVSEIRVSLRPIRLKFPRAGGKRAERGNVVYGLDQLVELMNEHQQDGAHVPPGGLSTRVLRQVRLGHDIRSIAGILDHVRQTDPKALEPDGYLGRHGITSAVLHSTPVNTSGRGRPRLSQAIYAAVAAEYAAAVGHGSRRPVKDIAQRTGTPEARVRARVATARRLGLLELSVWGSAGGRLTPAAKRLLKTTKGSGHGKATRTR